MRRTPTECSSSESMSALKVCVLISGSGTNLQALIDAQAEGGLPINIVHVISNVASATGLDKARAANIQCSVLEHGAYATREAFDEALASLMAAHAPQLFVFAGFMRVVGPQVVNTHAGRMINLHPSLLPLYPGLHTYQRAIEAGDSHHGASIHFLTSQLDGGPVISQVKIPINPSDTPADLAHRLGPWEHRLIVATVELFTRHKVECSEDRAWLDATPLDKPLQLGEGGLLHGD